MRGWTKLGTHARSSTSVLKTTTVFFSGKYGFSVLPSSLQSAIGSCPRGASRFLESVATTRTTTLAYNTQQITKFLAIQLVWWRIWHSENLLHSSTLWFTAAVGSGVCAIVATCVLALITSSEWRGWDSVSAHAQLSRIYLASTLDVTHVIMYQARSPLLSGESLGMRLRPWLIIYLFPVPRPHAIFGAASWVIIITWDNHESTWCAY